MASFDCRLLFSSLFVLSTANIILSNSSTVLSSVLSISQSHTQRLCLGISLSYLGVLMAGLFSLDIFTLNIVV